MIETLAQLPFVQQPLWPLLGLPDALPDYAGYGWAHAPAVTLTSETQRIELSGALLLVVHAADDGAALIDDVELEFALGPDDAITTRLSAFLTRGPLPTLASEIVLVMCNPHRADLRTRLAAMAPGTKGHRWWFAYGDVTSWLLPTMAGDEVLCLAAETWHRVPA